MNFFQKLSGSAIKAARQGMQMISAVAEAALTSPTPQPQQSPPQQLLHHFQAALRIIDDLAHLENSDSVEVDSMLFESKIKIHLNRMYELLQRESERWCMDASQLQQLQLEDGQDHEHDIETPCLDTFLQHHMMQALCQRAIHDTPRGCLPLLLGTIAAWLRGIRYPLLPHQSVHKHISRLISVASRFDAMHFTDATISATAAADLRQDLMTYKKRVDTGLTALVGVVWRRIAENPPMLDFFTVYDIHHKTQPDSKLVQSVVPQQIQMDVLTALIALMGKPRVGAYAKEALLVAVNMKDNRIDHFILFHTKLIANMVTELVKKFNSATDLISSSSSSSHSSSFSTTNNSSGSLVLLSGQGLRGSVGLSSPLTPTSPRAMLSSQTPSTTPMVSSLGVGMGTPLSARSRQALTPRQAETKPSVIDAFARAIRLIDAVAAASFVALSLQIPTALKNGHDDDSVVTTVVDNSLERDEAKYFGQSSLTTALLQEYKQNFLIAVVQPLFLSSVETRILAVTALMKRLLLELSAYSVDGPLLVQTTAFLTNNSHFQHHEQQQQQQQDTQDVCDLLLSRCLSISKPVSESSLLLLSQLLAVSDIPHGLFLSERQLAKSLTTTTGSTSNMDKQGNNTFFSSPSLSLATSTTILHQLNTFSSTSSVVQQELKYLLQAVQREDVETSATTTTTTTTTTKIRLDNVNQYLNMAQLRPEDALFDPIDNNKRGGQRCSVDPAYFQSSIGTILGRLNGRINNIHHIVQQQRKQHHNQQEHEGKPSGLLLILMMKLNSFQALRLEEQLAVSSLLFRYMSIIGTVAVACSSANESEDDTQRIDILLLLLLILEDLWSQVRIHISTVQDPSVRFNNMRNIMLFQATSSIQQQQHVGYNNGAVFDDKKESAVIRQTLQTAVVVREMLGEARGLIKAVRSLRTSLHLNTNIAAVGENPSATATATAIPTATTATTTVSGMSVDEQFFEDLEDLEECEKIHALFGVEVGALKQSNQRELQEEREEKWTNGFMEECEDILQSLSKLASTSQQQQ